MKVRFLYNLDEYVPPFDTSNSKRFMEIVTYATSCFVCLINSHVVTKTTQLRNVLHKLLFHALKCRRMFCISKARWLEKTLNKTNNRFAHLMTTPSDQRNDYRWRCFHRRRKDSLWKQHHLFGFLCV